MPQDKNFKRLVRDRMTKTGERFTAARAQLQTQRHRSTSTDPEAARTAAARDLSKQVEHLRDAADAALAAGMAVNDISRCVGLDEQVLRSWLLTESLDGTNDSR